MFSGARRSVEIESSEIESRITESGIALSP
jgi:hypothetical protein